MELATRWEARCVSGRRDRRGGVRQRDAAAGSQYELVFFDRLLATLVYLRTGLAHAALGVIYEVGSSTIGRAIAGIRPPLAERGFAVPNQPRLRPRTLEDVFAYAEAENATLRIDGVETQVRRREQADPGGGRSSPASAGRTRSRRRPSATASAAPPADPLAARRAPNSYSSARRPAETPTSRTSRPTRPKINRGAAR
ncbi:transposase family protein [Streptomyces sp. NPDC048301]|uniref:helix-turn-helix domain-containing protein n=1 Tax=unclassified Streptomyces TaxID=2593676 RepID=UPI00341AE363